MKIRTALLAMAAVSALSTGAFAADNSRDQNHPSSRQQMADRCSALESQYDSIIGANQNAPKVHKAEGLHAQGVDQCQSNNSTEGAQKLEQSLRDLGIKPAA